MYIIIKEQKIFSELNMLRMKDMRLILIILNEKS